MKKIRKAARIARDEGFVVLAIKSLQKIQQRNQKNTTNELKKRSFFSLVYRDDVMAVKLFDNKSKDYLTIDDVSNKVITWVMSPPAGGGGHQNIFRFIDFLDDAGYTNKVYLYSTFDDTTPQEASSNVSNYSKAKNTKFYNYDSKLIDEESLAIFATGWETAYPVQNLKTRSRKYYFVQDFEPLFYPMGTEYILAENTYRFGFKGITAGGWLSSRLSSEYGMEVDHYNFGADTDRYHVENRGERKSVFFYARPVTERRGFDLGVMALEIFHKARPEYEINFAGWDVSEWSVPFPYVNNGAVSLDRLNGLYNESAAALVMSLTNMSLLPLELLASGTIPVVNEGDNNRLVSDNENIIYTIPTPQELASALIRAVDANSNSELATKMHESVKLSDWLKSGQKFIDILERDFGVKK